MYIEEVNHQFRSSLRTRQATNRLVIHHAASAGDVTAATIHQWHLDRGWLGIGYHYVIRVGGNIERGRPENTVGAHAGPAANSDSIGIVLAGNLSVHEPTTEQMVALVRLIKDIRGRLGNLEVRGHNDVMATTCPGENFPWATLNELLDRDDRAVKLTVNGRLTGAVVRIVNGQSQALVSGAWIKLRELAELLLADIEWDSETLTVNIIIK